MVCCAVVIGLTRLRSSLPEVTPEEQVPHVPLTDGLVSSPLAVALNPAIDEEDIQNTMVNLPEEELNENEASPPEEEEQKPPQ